MTTLRLREQSTIPRDSPYYDVLEERRVRLEAALRRRKEELLREQNGETASSTSSLASSRPSVSRTDSNASLLSHTASNPNIGFTLRTSSTPNLKQRLSDSSGDGVVDTPRTTLASPPLWPEFLEKLKELQSKYQKELDALYTRYEQRWREERDLKAKRSSSLPNTLDNEYLVRALGTALTQALAEVCERRPWDPIDYLSHWLRTYADNMRRKREESVNKLMLELAQEEQKAADIRRAAIILERKQIRDEEQRRREQYLEVQASIKEAKEPSPPPPVEQKVKKPEAKVKEIVYKEVTILLPTEAEDSPDEDVADNDESSPKNGAGNGLYTIAEGDGETESNRMDSLKTYRKS